jgi:hypothetical protein
MSTSSDERKAMNDACLRCLACCIEKVDLPTQPGQLGGQPVEVQRHAQYCEKNGPDPRMKLFIPCHFLDYLARRCTIYDHLPGECRRLEPGGPACLRHRRRLYGTENPSASDTKMMVPHKSGMACWSQMERDFSDGSGEWGGRS